MQSLIIRQCFFARWFETSSKTEEEMKYTRHLESVEETCRGRKEEEVMTCKNIYSGVDS